MQIYFYAESQSSKILYDPESLGNLGVWQKKGQTWTSLVVQCLRLCTLYAGGTGSKNLHAEYHSQKIKSLHLIFPNITSYGQKTTC